MKRGEVWSAAGGADHAGKPRPVVIVQDDAFAETASISICGLTTTGIGPAEFRVAIEPGAGNGLRERSWLMADKITTVPRGRLGRRIGALSAAEMKAVEKAMMVFLGLAGGARGRGAGDG